MTTVTRLKAEVNNENLPILGNDGQMYHNYYYGRFFNAITDLGYTPTNEEKQAIEEFIADGEANGWIDMVFYFMPFIGDRQHPMTGLVPLIDKVANYDLAVDSVEESAFSYDAQDKIKQCGGTNTTVRNIKLPVTEEAVGRQFSPFVNFNIEPTNNQLHILGGFASIINDGVASMQLRGGNAGASTDIATHVFVYRLSRATEDATDAVQGTVNGSYLYEGYPNMSAYAAYLRNNDGFQSQRYISWHPDGVDPVYGPLGNTNVTYFGGGSYHLGTSVQAMLHPFNVFAIMDARNINGPDIASFEQAVHRLVVSLGKASA